VHARTLLALDVDGVILDPERGGRGPWQLAFSERFGVDAGRLDETLFAGAWADVITGKRPVESALNEALQELGWGMGVDAALHCWFEEDFVTAPAIMAAATTWSQLGIPLAWSPTRSPGGPGSSRTASRRSSASAGSRSRVTWGS
jgi:hypothetical protein